MINNTIPVSIALVLVWCLNTKGINLIACFQMGYMWFQYLPLFCANSGANSMAN